MYEIGRVYIWQNMVGDCEYLNGSECIVTSSQSPGVSESDGLIYLYQLTDTMHYEGRVMSARAGQLRPKNPPPGEQKIRSMFEPKPVMEVA